MSSTTARALFVCTANECRSPFAEAIANRDAADLPIRFTSAGLDSWNRGVPEIGIDLGREMGLDLTAHRSRAVAQVDLASFDLVLALSRNHARELLAADHSIGPRLFTLKQFARWVTDHPRPRRAAVGPWLDAAAADRPVTAFLGADPADDVDDPVGEPLEYWRRVVGEIEQAIQESLAGLYATSRDDR